MNTFPIIEGESFDDKLARWNIFIGQVIPGHEECEHCWDHLVGIICTRCKHSAEHLYNDFRSPFEVLRS